MLCSMNDVLQSKLLGGVTMVFFGDKLLLDWIYLLHLLVCWLNKPEYAQPGQFRVTKSIAQNYILSYIVIIYLLCYYWKCYTMGFC